MQTSSHYKQTVAHRFGHAATGYHAQATVQQVCAAHLLDRLALWRLPLPPGPILEIGCGTGFITQGLIDRFPHRAMMITDLSAEMLAFCQTQVTMPPLRRSRVTFQTLDAEAELASTSAYALIVGGFVVQWFTNLTRGLQHLLSQLQPGGVLLLSFPTGRSFPEWRQQCADLGLPFTANALPDPEMLMAHLSPQATVYLDEVTMVTTHESAADFLRGLKSIGAGVNQQGDRLSLPQLKRLIHTWDAQTAGPIEVQHHIALMALHMPPACRS